jgi:hypothetical protein
MLQRQRQSGSTGQHDADKVTKPVTNGITDGIVVRLSINQFKRFYNAPINCYWENSLSIAPK